MQNKYSKYFQLSFENFSLNSSDLSENTISFSVRLFSYVLMATALVLWIVFNIVAIESYQFAPYPLVVMNLILYCVIATMANPNNSDEIIKNDSQIRTNKHYPKI